MKLTFLIPLLPFSLAAPPVRGVPVPSQDLAYLTTVSDLIVVGRVTDIADAGSSSVEVNGKDVLARRKIADFRVDRILKGSCRQSIKVRFDVPDLPIGYSGVSADTYRLLFLRQLKDGYMFASPYYPSLVAVQNTTVSEGEPLSRVVHELVSVLQAPDIAPAQKIEASFALYKTATTDVYRAWEKLLGAEDSRLGAVAAAGLLANDQMEGLPFAAKALLHPDTTLPEQFRRNLAAAIFNGVKNVAAIPTLVQLLAAPEGYVRRSAAFALRNTRSSAALDGLAIALQDSDFETRYYGVVGLAEVTGQSDWRPLEDQFRTNEKRYIDYWSRWASEHLKSKAR